MPDLDWFDGVAAGNYERPRHLPYRCPSCTRKLAEPAPKRDTFDGRRLCSACFHYETLAALSDAQLAQQVKHIKETKK